jgi:hypothetical protein
MNLFGVDFPGFSPKIESNVEWKSSKGEEEERKL